MNKNVKKAALFIIAASMATGALAGCGSKKQAFQQLTRKMERP